MEELQYTVCVSEHHFRDARGLFIEYAGSLPINLAFQQFSSELLVMKEMYGSPDGCLLLVYDNRKAVACAGYRKASGTICELKRMYVQPACRGRAIGVRLLTLLLDKARLNGYSHMRLDTLSSMKSAQKLYLDNGFYEISPYYHNPNEAVVYMEKTLS